MTKKRIQTKIAGSRFTFPVTAFIAAMLFAAAYLTGRGNWIPLAGVALSTLIVAEWSNSNTLIRIYSSMIPCAYMLLSILSAGYYTSLSGFLVQLCFIIMLYCLCRAYQDHTATGWTFYGFFAIGIASTLFVQILFYVPLLWILLFTKLQAGSLRCFVASLLGLITPYWFVAAWLLYTGNTDFFVDHFTAIAHFEPLANVEHADTKMLLSFSFILILSLTGIVHFLRKKHYDKIRTQMLYEALIILDIFTIVFLVLQPQHADCLLRIFTITTAPLIGHFLALTHTKITNIAFIVIVLLTFVLIAVNLWIPLPNFL